MIGIEDRELDDAALEALAEAHATPPSAGLRERIVGRAEREAEAARAGARVRRIRAVGAVAAGVALVLAGLLARATRESDAQADRIAAVARQNQELAAEIERQGAALVSMRAALGAQDELLQAQGEVLRLVGGPRVLTASLAPQAGSAGAGRVLVDATTGEAAIVLSGVAPPPAGKAYELWAIRGKKAPEPAGMIAIDGDRGTTARLPRVERPNEVTAFAVSIEPPGGSPAPTGPIVLLGPVA